MTPTFGELTTAAELDLTGARRYPLFTLDDEELMRMSATVRTCVDAVVRLADSTKRDGRAVLDPDRFWQQPLQDLLAQLDRARVRANALPHRSGELAGPSPVQRLARAAATVGAAVDLLATHFDVRPDGIHDRDDLAAHIDSIEGRRAAAVQAARFAALLAPISRDIALAIHANPGRRSSALAHSLLDVSEHLAAAEEQLPKTPGAEEHARGALAVIPAARQLRADSATTTHDVGVLLDRGIDSAERLHQLAFLDASRNTGPTLDPTALAINASAFASTQAMTARCLRHLSGRGAQIASHLTAPRIEREMRTSADAAENAYHRWLAVRDGLRGARALITCGVGVPMRADANDLILTIGRLVHTDPQWEPRAGHHDDIRSPQDLAPNAVKLGELCAGLHRVSTVQALTAHRQARLVHAMAHNGQLMFPTRWLPECDEVRGRYTPLPDDQGAVLLKRYVAARDATAEAAHSLGQIPQLLGCGRSNIAAQVELTRWRLPTAWRTAEVRRHECREPISVAR